MWTLDKWLLELVTKFSGYGILLYVVITCIISCILAFLIGLERQLKGEPAGIRTHALLAIGCSLLMTISIWAIRVADGSLDLGSTKSLTPTLNYDTSRIAAGVVAGVGFLGAGVIIKDKYTVRGLSTAATLWICSAIGLACGSGFIFEAIVATAITLLALFILNRLIVFINNRAPSILVVAKNDYPFASVIKDFSEDNGLVLKYVKIIECGEELTTGKLEFAFSTDPLMLQYICNQFKDKKEIEKIEILTTSKSSTTNSNE